MIEQTAATGDLAALYRDLHAHPELGFQEARTAQIVAQRLRSLGFETTTGVGTSGVVGILRNGDGPTALLRADTDVAPRGGLTERGRGGLAPPEDGG